MTSGNRRRARVAAAVRVDRCRPRRCPPARRRRRGARRAVRCRPAAGPAGRPRRDRRAGQRRWPASGSTVAPGCAARAARRSATADDVRRLAVRLAAVAGRRLDDASPWVDARLPDGARLHAVLPPIVQGAAHISLRIPRRRALSLADLVRAGTVPSAWEPVLRALVSARAAYLVTGGTGAGKTTLLSALLAVVPGGERLVVVEDAAELYVDHPHVVRLEGRAPNVEGAGGVSMTDLVRQALRMRPDRLVVGEVRGAGGPRSAGRAQHRARGRLRHAPRQRQRRPAGPAGGAGCAGRPGPCRRGGSGGQRDRGGRSPASTRTARGGSPRSRQCCPGAVRWPCCRP